MALIKKKPTGKEKRQPNIRDQKHFSSSSINKVYVKIYFN